MPDAAGSLIGLVPAAGQGLRLGLPYPKELYPVIRENRYKPVAQHIIENLVTAGVRHVVVVINETKHQLIGYFGDGHRFGCRLSYVVQEQASSHGTSAGLAEAIDASYHLTRGKTVAFGMADTIIRPLDVFATLLDTAYVTSDLVAGLFQTDQPEKFGMVEVGEAGEIVRIVDKPKHTGLRLMWGCMVWRAAFTESLRERLSSQHAADFAEIINDARRTGLNLRAVEIEGGTYVDLGTYDEIARLEREFRG